MKEVISTSITQTTTYEAGTIKSITILRTEYEYDSRGNMTKQVLFSYNAEGSIMQIVETTYTYINL